MRVAFVCEDVHRYGGTERVVYELATRLARRHEVHVYAATARDLDGTGVVWRRVAVPAGPTLVRVPAFAAVSSALVRRGRYDAVIGQGVNTFGAGFMAVHTVNAARRDIYRALAANGIYLGPARRAAERAWYELATALERRLLRRPGLRLIALSTGVAREIRRYYPGVAPDRVAVVFNGVDPAAFTPRPGGPDERARVRREWGVSEEADVLLFVGGLWWLKGVAHAIDALAYLPPGAVLVVVGKGDARPYRARARTLGVERRVHFAGVRGDMAPLYRAADCFVLPSHYEAFSLVTLEAMASGLPVLLSRVNGAEDCLRDGRNGFFVAPNGKNIAAKAEAVCGDAALRRRLGRAARRTALRFTWDAAAAGFDAAISGKGSGAAC